MNKKWWTIFGISLLFGTGLIVFGFLNNDLTSFAENVIGELAGLALALSVAIILIEGPILSKEAQVDRVVAIVSKRTRDINHEIASIVSREIGEYLCERLDTEIDLYGDERGDWAQFKPLLLQVYAQAKEIPENGLPETARINNIQLNDDDYSKFVKGTKSYIERIHRSIGTDWSIIAKTNMLPLLDNLNKLETYISFDINDPKLYYRTLGILGEVYIQNVDL